MPITHLYFPQLYILHDHKDYSLSDNLHGDGLVL